MSIAKNVIQNQLDTGMFLIEKFTADLSDQDYFHAPVASSNHTAWILGHLATSDDRMLSTITGKPHRLPKDHHELFRGGAPCDPSPSRYPARKAMDELFRTQRAHVVEALKMADQKSWDEPCPDENMRRFFPTVGSLWGMLGTHQFWHIGQLTVCRQSLRKPHVLM